MGVVYFVSVWLSLGCGSCFRGINDTYCCSLGYSALQKYSYPLNFSTFCNVSLFVSHNLLGFHVIYQHKGSHNRAVK